MKPDVPFQGIVQLRKNDSVDHIYDVIVEGFERLMGYDEVECHTVLYPYNRQVGSQHIAFYPFEEYVKDVLSQQRSAYAVIQSHFNEFFGVLLGLAIALVFARFKPDDLFSIESIVSVFGAYTIGKELWDDIERTLVNASKKWRVRFQDSYYRYRLEKHTTLTSYSYLAKQRRYEKAVLLPAKIDFIKQSNSQTLRAAFNMADLRIEPGPIAHLHSIHIRPELLERFEASGFMFGVKLSLNRRRLWITQHLELFQSIDHCATGCLDKSGQWIEGAVFYRRTFTCGRLKWYVNEGIIHDRMLVDCALPGFSAPHPIAEQAKEVQI
jgi:hypothetical protein